ncbi:helicase [Fusobacterium pseudoperiodonticum]|nr:helicase [Fusobacterium pseudoperiodonticum]
MNNKELNRIIRIYRKVDNNEPMEEMHKRIMEGLSKIEAPLGLKDSEIPKTPDFGTELICHYFTKNIKTKGVKIKGSYDWRIISPLVWWDTLKYEFKITYKLIDYQKIIYINLPKVIEIYDPYVVDVHVSPIYSIAYEEGRTPETITYYDSENPNFLKLKETGVQIGMLFDALFTLSPVMYFNEECYKKLIKVSKEELLKRLEGKAKKVLLLEKGIYIIFNDKADISYEEFVEMNETFKPLLGLI